MRLRVFTDAGSGAIVWPADREAEDNFGIPTDLEALGVPQALRDEADALCVAFDEAFPWDDPGGGDMAWTPEKEAAFARRLRSFALDLQAALGPRVGVEPPRDSGAQT